MTDAGTHRVFLTGATGFIGRQVLDRLVQRGGARITCLTRGSGPLPAKFGPDDGVQWVTGAVGEPSTYAEALRGADVLIHMAAATGAASATQLRAVNVTATQALLSAARDAGVRKFVFVSSIAVAGGSLDHYPYAESKLAAEEAVLDSGLACVMVRPTIVLGEGAPNWRMLRMLACLPLVPLFGGGTAKVQPVDVIDVARGLEWLAYNRQESGSIVELGGPEVLSFAAFLARIRAACGRRGFPHVSVPIAPVRMMLRLATRLLGARSPVGPGQLAPFVNDGVARPTEVFELLRPDMVPLDTLLQRVCRAEQDRAR